MGLTLMGKRPGAGWHAEVEELSFAQQPGSDMRPYDRLIGAALDGLRLPFARHDAVEAAWRVVDPSWVASCPCIDTPGAAGVQRKPTPCCPTALAGMTPGERTDAAVLPTPPLSQAA
jgi:hypothetical protein